MVRNVGMVGLFLMLLLIYIMLPRMMPKLVFIASLIDEMRDQVLDIQDVTCNQESNTRPQAMIPPRCICLVQDGS